MLGFLCGWRRNVINLTDSSNYWKDNASVISTYKWWCKIVFYPTTRFHCGRTTVESEFKWRDISSSFWKSFWNLLYADQLSSEGMSWYIFLCFPVIAFRYVFVFFPFLFPLPFSIFPFHSLHISNAHSFCRINAFIPMHVRKDVFYLSSLGFHLQHMWTRYRVPSSRNKIFE